MTHPFWLNRSLSTVLSLVTASSIISGASIPTVKNQPLTISFNNSSQQSFATTSGGRTRGGGFGDDKPDEAERSTEPAPSRSYSENNYRRSNHNYDRYNNGYNNSNGNSGGGVADVVIFLMFFIFLVYLITSGTLNALIESAKKSPTGTNAITYSTATPPISVSTARTASSRLSTEITNNIVTVTQVQVAMLSQARHVQQALNQIAENTDMSDKQDLTTSLRETVLALLRSPETWTHAAARSKTVATKQAAKEKFEDLSLEERSKFNVKSLSNIDGKVKKQAIVQSAEDLAAYIVVTLIVGTAHDSPLLKQVTSADELKTALKKLGSVTPEYLMVYEVLWSPQAESDSLTDNELLLNYPNMLQIS